MTEAFTARLCPDAVNLVFMMNGRKHCGAVEGGREEEEEGWKQLRRFLNNEKQMTVFLLLHRLHVRARQCAFSKLYCSHIWTMEAAACCTLAERRHNTAKGFFLLAVRLVLSEPSLARPCGGLHRGECAWDGVAVGLTGRRRFLSGQ